MIDVEDLGHTQKEIKHWIESHGDEMVVDIQKLIEYKSISKKSESPFYFGEECGKVLDEILELGTKYGFSVHNCEYRCGTITYGKGEHNIGIWNHLDVVSEGEDEDWIYPPYKCIRKGDFLFARGVQDNKGPAIASLYAMRCIKDLNIPIKSSISQIVGCDEENQMEDIEYYKNHYPLPDFSFVADCSFPVCYGEKGICEVLLTTELSDTVIEIKGGTYSNIVPDKASIRFGDQTIETKGISGHVAFPEGTHNAIGVLFETIYQNELLDEKDRKKFAFLKEISTTNYGEALDIKCQDEISGELTCVASIIKLIDNQLELHLNIRYPIFSDIKNILENIHQKSSNNGFKMKVLRNSMPSYFDKESPYVKTLMEAYNFVIKDKLQPYTMGGGSYARKIPNGVGFGPGLAIDTTSLGLSKGHGSCHSPNEVQSISNLYKAIEIYVLALIGLDKELNKNNNIKK